MRRHNTKPQLRAVEGISEAPAHHTSEDASPTLEAGWSEAAALAIGPAVGAVVLFAVGAMVYAPDVPERYWILPALGLLYAALWLFAGATHAWIKGPAYVLFGLSWARRTLVGVVAHYAIGGAVLLFVALGVGVVLYLSPETPLAPRPVVVRKEVARIAPAASVAAKTQPAPALAPVAVLPASENRVAPLLRTLRRVELSKERRRPRRGRRS